MKAIIPFKRRKNKIHLSNAIGLALCNRLKFQENYTEIEIDSSEIDSIDKPLSKKICKECWKIAFSLIN